LLLVNANVKQDPMERVDTLVVEAVQAVVHAADAEYHLAVPQAHLDLLVNQDMMEHPEDLEHQEKTHHHSQHSQLEEQVAKHVKHQRMEHQVHKDPQDHPDHLENQAHQQLAVEKAQEDHQAHAVPLEKLVIKVHLDPLEHQENYCLCLLLFLTIFLLFLAVEDQQTVDHPAHQDLQVNLVTQEDKAHQESQDMLAVKAHLVHKAHPDLQDILEHPEDLDKLEVMEDVVLVIIVHLHVHHQDIRQKRKNNWNEKTTQNRRKCKNKIWRFSSNFVHLKRIIIKILYISSLNCIF
jgi:hypothetical protein